MKCKYNVLLMLLFLSEIAFVFDSNGNTEKYRLMFGFDPSSSVTIGWNKISGIGATVCYGTTDQGTNWLAYPFHKTVDRTINYRGMKNSFVRLTNLLPNTIYYFVITDSDSNSRRFWFKTAPNSPEERLSFIAGGDSRNNRVPRQKANLLVAKLKPHAVLFGGDMTDGDSDGEWEEWFDDWQLTISSDGRIIPIVPARGNHEDSNKTIYNLFDTSSGVYYALTFGGNIIRTYTLNTEASMSGSQANWLDNDLIENKNTIWKIAQYHKSMRPHVGSKEEGNMQYDNWAKVFSDNMVQLVIESDSHTVKTTWPLLPSKDVGSDQGFIRADKDPHRTVYIGEGCWGAPLRTADDIKSWTRNSGRFNQFKWIFVDKDKIEIQTIKIDNATEVGQVSDSNIFVAPANLDIWSPDNGAIVYINNSKEINVKPVVAINTPLVNSSFNNTSKIMVDVIADDYDSISKVEFFAGEVQFETDFSTPYRVFWNADTNGNYVLKVKAYDSKGMFNESYVNVFLNQAEEYKILGNNVIGKNSIRHINRKAMPFTTTEWTEITSISIYHGGGVGKMVLGIYNNNNGVPSNLLEESPITMVDSKEGWQTVNLKERVFALKDEMLWIAWVFEVSPYVYYDYGNKGAYNHDGSIWGDGIMPGVFGIGSQEYFYYSIHANYKNTPLNNLTDSKDLSFRIFPNPNKTDIINLELNEKTSSKCSMKFCDVNDHVKKSVDFFGHHNTIDISDLPHNNIYFIQLTIDGQESVQKFIRL